MLHSTVTSDSQHSVMVTKMAVAGKLCSVDINECVLYPTRCRNGATCQNTNGSYVCHCPRGYHGRYCDMNPNDCQPGLHSFHHLYLYTCTIKQSGISLWNTDQVHV